MTKKKANAKAGRPPTVEGGLSQVLYVRVAPELLEQIDERAAKERAARKGRVVSRADMIRELLNLALTFQ